MSSSYASPPSPSVTRRRQVVVTATAAAAEQRSNTLTELAASPSSNERPLADGRDPGQQLHRGGQLLRGVVDPRSRQRRPTPKPVKPRWLTIMSVLMKNAILLLLLVWLGMAIWRWKDHYVPSSGTPFDNANRLTELEDMVNSLRKAMKMAQVQVDVMDERSKMTQGQVDVMDERYKKTEEATIGLEKYMSKFNSFFEERLSDFLTKEEFEAFGRKLEASLNAEGRSKGFGPNEISCYARGVVIEELEKHAADGIGRADYALAAAGGRVIKHSKAYGVGKLGSWLPAIIGRGNVHFHAQKMLEPSFGEPGQCFSLKGNSGFVDIELRRRIILDAITLEHVSERVAYDRSSAPKGCRVWGLLEGAEDNDPVREHEKMTLLKEFSYDLDANNIQTFSIEMAPTSLVKVVRLEFESNHGNPSLTCIYRFRVHGNEPKKLPKDGGKV